MYILVKYKVCGSDSKHTKITHPKPIGHIYSSYESYGDLNTAYRKLEQLHDNLAVVNQCNECLYEIVKK